MNSSRLRLLRFTRLWLVVGGLAVIFAVAIPTLAGAGHEPGAVASYTGCLSTPAQGGVVYNLRPGDGPATCRSGHTQIHLSGGDITAVNAGTGLAGTATSGAANLSVNYADFGSCAEGSAIRVVGTTATCQTTFSGYELVSVPYAFFNSTSSNTIEGGSAICPAGKRALGGGYSRSLGPNDPIVQVIDQSLREDLPPDGTRSGYNVNFVLEPGQEIHGNFQAACAFVG